MVTKKQNDISVHPCLSVAVQAIGNKHFFPVNKWTKSQTGKTDFANKQAFFSSFFFLGGGVGVIIYEQKAQLISQMLIRDMWNSATS